MRQTRHEIAVGIRDVSHDSVESRVVTNCVSVGEMKKPNARSYCIAPSQWDRHTRTKIETHVQPASIGERHIVSEAHKTAVDIEKRLIAPLLTRCKLQPNGSAATICVFAAVRNTSRMDDKGLDVQIAADE